MKAYMYRITATACALLTLGLLLGCETEPSEQIALTITPNNVTLRKGESQQFTATGLQDYTWEIVTSSDGSVGVLSTKKGNSTVYTAIAEGPLTVVLRVSAIRSGDSDTTVPGTQQTPRLSAEAIITHQEPPPEDEDA